MAAGIARGEAWWRDCFQRYPQSGMAIEAFCKQEQVAISSFYLWKKRLALKDKLVAKSKPQPLTASHWQVLLLRNGFSYRFILMTSLTVPVLLNSQQKAAPAN